MAGVLAAIGVGTVGLVAPTEVAADSGIVLYNCNFGVLPINVTGSIPGALHNGQHFNISGYQVQITVPADTVQALEQLYGITELSGSATAEVDMLGATPSSMTPDLGGFSVLLPNPPVDESFFVAESPSTLGPFTATSSHVAAEAGEINLTFTSPSGQVGTCDPPGHPVIGQIITGSGPFGLVADGNDGTATAFSPNNTGIPSARQLSVGGNPDYVAMTPDGSEGLVSTWPNGRALVPVNTTTLQTGTPIPINAPRGVAITPDGSTAWVAGGSGDDTFYPVDLSNDSVGTGVSLGTGGSAASVAITPDGSTAYVVGQFVGLVRVNLGSETVESPVGLGGDGSGLPGEIQITPDGTHAIVTAGDQLIFVDLTHDPAGVIGYSKPCGAGVDLSHPVITPDGNTVYVGCSGAGTLVPVSTTTEGAGSPYSLGTGSDSLSATAISADASTVYVTDTTTNTVVRLQFQDGPPIITSIPTGSGPDGIGLPPAQGPKAFLSVSSDQSDPQGLTEDFDASGSLAGSSPIETYRWHFGDGSADVNTLSPTTSHKYAAAGTYTATVTETDQDGTSTRVVSTGQEILRNGSAAATASATFTLSSCASGCTPTQNSGNTTSQVTQEGSTTGTLTLSVSPGQLDCLANYQQRQEHQITSLTESSAFSSSTPILVKETITGLATTTGVKVCYQPGGVSPPAPKYLPKCKKHPAPCVKSAQVTGPGTVVATLEVPPGDPRYWVDTGVLGLSTFTPLLGKAGVVVTIKGTNLKQVVSVLFSGPASGFVQASALTISSTGTSMKTKVPAGAVTGPVEVVTPGGIFISTKKFTVT
jgi:DNA-binding beta-propeller fold protein YncE